MLYRYRTSMMKIPNRATPSVERRKTRMFLPVLLLAGLCILGTLRPMVGTVFAQNGKVSKESPGQTDVQRLEGRWVRPDGGYILELREIKKDGSVSAAYFNPRPIKVFRAVWNHTQGVISVLIELRDVNYPGSKYNLQYDPKADQLKGTYFQAVEKQTYFIEFVRAK